MPVRSAARVGLSRYVWQAALAVAFLAGPAVRAQESIITDRPGLGLNPVTVPAGTVQVEIGAPALAVAGESYAYAFTALARLGVVPGLELRLGSAALYTLAVPATGGPREGAGDVEVGLKAAMPADDGIPAVGIVLGLVLPTGAGGFTAGEPVLNAAVASSLALPNDLALTATLAGAVPAAEEALASGGLVLALGRPLTPALAGYVEAGYSLIEGPAGNDVAYVGAGAAYLVAPTVQLDVFVDVGLTDAAADALLGVGLSARF